MPERYCRIIDGSVGSDTNAADDGAYDLFQVAGTPEELGAMIADSLNASELYGGECGSYVENGIPIYLKLTIRIAPSQAVDESLPKEV